MKPNLMIDPFNKEYAMDIQGNLYRHTIIETDAGARIDIGYSLVQAVD